MSGVGPAGVTKKQTLQKFKNLKLEKNLEFPIKFVCEYFVVTAFTPGGYWVSRAVSVDPSS